MSEETTKGLVKRTLSASGYPQNQDVEENGITIYKEESYNDFAQNDEMAKFLKSQFASASKSLSGNKGAPDFTITNRNAKVIIVIECKEDLKNHQTFSNLNDYKKGLGNEKEISSKAINGALHYATFINNGFDVIAIAVSGISDKNIKCSVFLLPSMGTVKDIKFLSDGDLTVISSFKDYQHRINIEKGVFKEETENVIKELKKYSAACNKFLRANGISPEDRAGFLSALVMAKTEEDSAYFKAVKNTVDKVDSGEKFEEGLGKQAIGLLFNATAGAKGALQNIWENIDDLSAMKEEKLEQYYNHILSASILKAPEYDTKYFTFGENILSTCSYSIYKNITLKIKNYPEVDIMGTFYTTFLKYAKGDTKDKGIVLTPKHITELFCDIAEIFLERKLDEKTKVLDVCCGTGAFLIAALNRMDYNIVTDISRSEKNKKQSRREVRKSCLVGIDNDEKMFALAYANMRFHGDGKSNLFCNSSLRKDDEITRTYKGKKVTLYEELTANERPWDDEEERKLWKRPVIGMTNPPYSLLNEAGKKNKSDKQAGKSELDFVYSMLSYLETGGIGIAIVPQSCAHSKSDLQMRKNILENNTLLAVMTMPNKLFQDSKVGTATCVMVFRAGIPHSKSSKNVFLARWTEDGFITVPHVGRYDKEGTWLAVKQEWCNQLKGLADRDNTCYIRRVTEADEPWLAELYVETDYTKLTAKDFEAQLKKYALFKYMQENGGDDV